MSAEIDNPPDKPEIAYILFIDTVGYSKLAIGEQHAVQGSLTRIVRETGCFREAKEAGKLVRLPTGDGMALVFADDIEAPLNCAIEIATALRRGSLVYYRYGAYANGRLAREVFLRRLSFYFPSAFGRHQARQTTR